MDTEKIKHPVNQTINIVRFKVDIESKEIQVILIFKDFLEALVCHEHLTSLGSTYGLTVIENYNGLRVVLEFSNETNILYTKLIPYFKVEFHSLDLTSEFSIRLHFVYDNNEVPTSFKDEILAFIHKI